MNLTYNHDIIITISVADVLWNLSQQESLEVIKEMSDNHEDFDYDMKALNRCFENIESVALDLTSDDVNALDFDLLERLYAQLKAAKYGS